jgi:hypothetical protein
MAGQPPNEEGEDSGMHSLQESYLDQILRSLKSEQDEISAAPSPAASTHDASAAAGSSSYATRMPPGSSSNIQAAPPDQLGGSGGGSAGSALNPWPFISASASRHPATGVPRSLQTKQEAGKQESEQLYRDVVDTPGSSSSFHRDLQFMSEFPAWFIQDEGLEQQGAGVVVGGSQIPGSGPSSYSSRFSDRPEDVDESFDAQLGNFRMSSSSAGLDAAAQAAAGRRSRISTAVQPTSSESLYGAGPQQGRMWHPASLESISSMQQTPIPAAAPRAGPRGPADAIEPPAARGRSTTMNPETPTSSLSLGSSSEGDDDAERRSSSRGRHQTAASPAAEEGASSAKRKTPERSLEEAGGKEQSTKSGSESKRLQQHSL